MFTQLPVKEIKQSNNYCRADVGDVTTLMHSMKTDGLLHPITVRKRGKNYIVVAGHRRLNAAKKLGWPAITVNLLDGLKAVDEVSINMAENLDRKDVTIAEIGKGFSDLKKMGLTSRQIGIRLGVPLNFVKEALDLWKVVPAKFHDKITPQFGHKKQIGKISFKAARDCTNLKRTHRLTAKQYNVLLESAKAGYTCGQLTQIATKLGAGSTVAAARKSGGDISRVNVVFHADQKKRKRFEKKVGMNISKFIRQQVLKNVALKNVLTVGH